MGELQQMYVCITKFALFCQKGQFLTILYIEIYRGPPHFI